MKALGLDVSCDDIGNIYGVCKGSGKELALLKASRLIRLQGGAFKEYPVSFVLWKQSA